MNTLLFTYPGESFTYSGQMPHSQVSDYVKTDIAMSHLTCLGENFPWSCHKVTYSLRKVTELCPNDIITLIDDSRVKYLTTNVKMSHR
jgi:hypothetical protein